MLSKLKPLSIFVALDLNCKSRIDIPIDDGVLILEWSDELAPAMGPMYAFLLDTIGERRLAEQIAKQEALIVDEFRILMPLECIENIARRGRKSGVSLFLNAPLHKWPMG